MNVATFVIFRILLLGWMTRWLTLHRDDVPIVFFTVGSLGLATIVGMNIVLFYRILLGDYLGKSSPQGKEDSAELKDASCDNHAAADACEASDELKKGTANARKRNLTSNMNRIVRSLFDEQELIVVDINEEAQNPSSSLKKWE